MDHLISKLNDKRSLRFEHPMSLKTVDVKFDGVEYRFVERLHDSAIKMQGLDGPCGVKKYINMLTEMGWKVK